MFEFDLNELNESHKIIKFVHCWQKKKTKVGTCEMLAGIF